MHRKEGPHTMATHGPAPREGAMGLASPVSRRRFLIGSSALIATGALTAACGGSSSNSATSGSGATVQISTGKTVETANFFVADAQGFYKKHGLNAQLKSFTIPINGAQAMLAGTENVAELVQLPFLTFLKNGADLIIAANTCTSKNVYLVTTSRITKPQDLIGAKIGFPFSTGQQYAFAAYLQHVNIQASQVPTVNVQNENLVAAMSAGSLDGFLGIQPQVSQTLTNVRGTHIFDNPPATSAYVSPEYLVMERSWAEGHRKQVEAIIGALMDAGDYIKGHKAETAKIMAPVMGLPDSQVETLMGPNPEGDEDDFSITLDQTTISNSLKDVAQWMMSAGLLQKTPDIARAIDPSYLKAVAPSAVTGHV